MKVLLSTVAAGFVGALVGIFVSVFNGWTSHWFLDAAAGGIVGGGNAALLGLIMAYHASGMGRSRQKTDAAPIWGAVTGVTYGMSLGPVFGGIVGFTFGAFLDFIFPLNTFGVALMAAGAFMGLYLGPIVSVLAWEAGFALSAGDEA